jgi:predicted dehydrogenase
MMRLGLVGYGVGGRYFHAPFIQAADGVDLVGVVTRSPERRRILASDFPDLPVYDDLDKLLEAGVDAVTITTPPETRRQLVLQALAAGARLIILNAQPTPLDARADAVLRGQIGELLPAAVERAIA